MARSGRPRANLEKAILAEMSENLKRIAVMVAEKLKSSEHSRARMTFEAACLLLILEHGTDYEKARCEPLIRRLRETKWGQSNDPYRKLPDRDFLEDFIQYYAPNWNWRKDATEGEIEDKIYKQENERIAKAHAEDVRWKMALTNKFCTPDAPDAGLLGLLAWEWRHKPLSPEEMKRPGWSVKQRWKVIRRTWPTLRELKLATAIPERVIKKIIANLRPRKGEIVKQPIRNRSSKSGTVPCRYGPRLVIGVIDEFVNRLPEFPIADEGRKRLRKTATCVKRAFVARLSRSR